VSRRIDEEFVRNMSVRARKEVVLKVLELAERDAGERRAAGQKNVSALKVAAELMGVSRQALWAYREDRYQPSDREILRMIDLLTREEFHRILLDDLRQHVASLMRHIGEDKVRRVLLKEVGGR